VISVTLIEKTMKYLSVVLAAMLCTGCGLAAVKYVEPTGGPVATVHFQNNSDLTLKLNFYETSKDCKGRLTVDVPIVPQTSDSHVVAANTDVTFEYLLSDERPNTQGRHCLFNIRFHPKDGRIYTFQTGATHFGCKVSMVDSTEPGKPTPVPLKTIPWDSKWGRASAFCEG
jgi:hypothetical protein